MKESEELKAARTEYLAKLTRYGGLPMPATAHYTAGYKDGSDMLWAIAQNCAEVEHRLEHLTKQRDLAVDVMKNSIRIIRGGLIQEAIQCIEETIDAIKESEGK